MVELDMVVELGIIWWQMEVVCSNMVVDSRIGGEGGGIGNNMVVYGGSF